MNELYIGSAYLYIKTGQADLDRAIEEAQERISKALEGTGIEVYIYDKATCELRHENGAVLDRCGFD